MTSAVSISIATKVPKVRIWVSVAVCMALRPLMLPITVQERIGNALMAWIQRGLRVYVDGKRV